jgi:surface antigen
MAIISDETLMAYADGELSPSARRSVRQTLARDPALAQKLDSFVATGRLNLSDAFDDILSEPVPPHLLEAVLGTRHRPAQAAAPLALLVDCIRRWRSILRVSTWSLAAVPALSVGLVLGAVGSWLVQPSGGLVREMGGRLIASGPLQQVLETTPSGTAIRAGQDMFEPESTFYSQKQEWCREYQLLAGAENRFKGLACRSRDGTWRVDIHAQARSTTAYAPAAHGVVADAVEKLMQGQPLALEAEKRLIKEAWRTP